MKILVTGFKPFLGQNLNPSEKLATDLFHQFSDHVEMIVLPVEFNAAFEVLKKNKNLDLYDHIILIGQATGRSKIGFEKVALNWVQTEHRDESGFKPETGKISENSPAAYFSRFPIDKISEAVKKKNFPIEISFSAGTYVCNDLYFRCLDQFQNKSIVFIHVPMIEEQIRTNESSAYLSYEIIKNSLFEAVRHLIESSELR